MTANWHPYSAHPFATFVMARRPVIAVSEIGGDCPEGFHGRPMRDAGESTGRDGSVDVPALLLAFPGVSACMTTEKLGRMLAVGLRTVRALVGQAEGMGLLEAHGGANGPKYGLTETGKNALLLGIVRRG